MKAAWTAVKPGRARGVKKGLEGVHRLQASWPKLATVPFS